MYLVIEHTQDGFRTAPQLFTTRADADAAFMKCVHENAATEYPLELEAPGTLRFATNDDAYEAQLFEVTPE